MSQADEEESLLPPDEEAELLLALEAALRPGELDPRVNERLLELALEDPLAPASEEELIESARLRDALAAGTPDADANLLRALAAPFDGRLVSESADADDSQASAAVERALGAALVPTASAPPAPRRNVIYAVFGGASALLAAAAVAVLFVGLRSAAPVAAQASAYVVPHSTAELFAERFETGDTTARVDLIASARSRDLRDNRYAAWGVR